MVREIGLTQGQIALVDDEDFDKLNQFKWYASKQPNTIYAIHDCPRKKINGKIKRTKLRMHRFILNASKGTVVDHIDGNGLNNQKTNLRIVSHRQNMQNQVNRTHQKSSKYPGVTWNKNKQRWRAMISVNGESKQLGYFKNELDAAKCYENACRKLCGEELVCKMGVE